MSAVTFNIISIGALAAHPLRDEKSPVRHGHGTTTLIVSQNERILVDPALPPSILAPRLHERAGLEPADITQVFLTSFRPDLRQGLPLFEHAKWWINEIERETVGVALISDFKKLEDLAGDDESASGDETAELIRQEIGVLQRCDPAPDQLAPSVDLFPLPGRTPGQCGLLLAHPNHTALVCGDAIPTIEHLDSAKVLPDCVDIKQAQESFQEAIEIADMLILGRDNYVMNPLRRPF